MNNRNEYNRNMVTNFFKANSAREVEVLMQEYGLSGDLADWVPLGGIPGNYSVVGNQQSSPVNALTEKITNSVDAILERICRENDINPKADVAPKTAEELGKLAGGLNGKIIVACEGVRQSYVNVSVIDDGVGQKPDDVEPTMLSLLKGNKAKIPFVIGKFNQGGSGAYMYCKYTLILTKRNHCIPHSETDETFGRYAFTVVRHVTLDDGSRCSEFQYLKVGGELISFEADSLDIIPQRVSLEDGVGYQPFIEGAFIKMIEYNLGAYRTHALLDLNNRLSLLLPQLPLPVEIRECRDYDSHAYSSKMYGIVNKLISNSSEVLETGFPSDALVLVDNQEMKLKIFLLKPGKEDHYRGRHEGILFALGGQTQYVKQDMFFKSCGYNYVAKSLLIVADCSALDVEHQEMLFMANRTSLRDTDFTDKTLNSIRSLIRQHAGIQAVEKQRHDLAAKANVNQIASTTIFQKIASRVRGISNVYAGKMPLTARSMDTISVEDFQGADFPSYFQWIVTKSDLLTKTVSLGDAFRATLKTDVRNDYFVRQINNGEISIIIDDEIRNELLSRVSLHCGHLALSLLLPSDVEVGDEIEYVINIRDSLSGEVFCNRLNVVVGELAPKKPRVKRADSYPDVVIVSRESWADSGMDEKSAVFYEHSDFSGDVYKINADNIYLRKELTRAKSSSENELMKARYIYGMLMLSIGMVNYCRNYDLSIDVEETVASSTSMSSQMLLPMFDLLGEQKLLLADDEE